MCYTPWCDGSCDECIADAKRDKEYEESNSECPHRKECNWKTVDVKTDICTTCGKTTNY